MIELPASSDLLIAEAYLWDKPSGVGQQRREPQHPPVDGDVVDLDAALGQQFFDVAIGQAEAQGPGDRHDDRIGWEAKPAKAERAMGVGRGRPVFMPVVSRLERRHSERNSTPRVTLRACG